MADLSLPRRSAGAAPRGRGIQLPTAGNVPTVTPTRDPGVRVPTPVRSGLEDLGTGLSSAADSIYQAAERQQKQYDATQIGEAELKYGSAISDEYRRRQTEDDPSRPQFMSDFERWMAEQANKTGADLPKDVSDFAKEKLRLRLEAKRAAMRDEAGQLSLKASGDKAKDIIGQTVNQRAAQAERDPAYLDTILGQVDDRLGDFKGTLNPNEERDQRTAARSTVIKSALMGMARQDEKGSTDAETIIASGKYDKDLTREDRMSVQAVIKSERAERSRLADRQEREAAKRMKEEGDQLLKDYYDKADHAALTAADLEKLHRHPGITPAEYKGAAALLHNFGNVEHDNGEFLASVMPRLHTEDLTTELTQGLRDGKLKSETYRALLNQNQSAMKDDRPASPFRQGRSFLSNVLDPGQLGGSPYIRAALEAGRVEALSEFDAWAADHPGFSADESLNKAREIRDRYENVRYTDMSLALPRPRGYVGRKDQIAMDDVIKAQNLLRQEILAGRVSSQEAMREGKQIEAWQAIATNKLKQQQRKNGQSR